MKTKTVSGIMLTLLLISVLNLAFNTTPVLASSILSDDFNDNTINSDLWGEGQSGGTTVDEINQRLEVYFPWDSAGTIFGAGYWSKPLLRGDFDIQVDFSLLDWPSVDQLGTGNGVRIGLAVGEGENAWSVQRTSLGNLFADFPGYPREVYVFHFPPGPVKGITPTDDMSGKLRLVRSGNTLTGYYFSSGSWVTVASEWVTTGDVWFGINAWSHDNVFMDNNVLLAFDNFIVNIIPASLDIDPDTLNLKSQGQWITAYIQLPEGYDPEGIDATTILLNDITQPILDPKFDFVTNPSEYLVDHDDDGILERMVKFDRAEMIALLSADEATLRITGKADGTRFEGSDTIRVKGEILTLIGPWSGAEMDAFMPILQAFEEKTGIDVGYKTYRAEDLATLLPAQFENGTTPGDVIFMWPWWIAEKGQEGHILDVTDLIDETDFFTGVLDPVKVGNTLYGGPWTGRAKPGFWYRKSFFETHGLTPPNTWDEFIVLLENLASIPGVVNPIASGDAVGWPLSDVTEHFLITFGGLQLHRDLTTGATAWNSSTVRTIFADRLVPLLEDGYFSTPLNWDILVNSWWNGDFGLYFMGSWIIGMVDDPDDLGVFALPGAEGLVFACDYFFIPAYTPYLKEAKELFKFLVSEEAQRLGVEVEMWTPLATNINVPFDAYPPAERQVVELMVGKELLTDLDDTIGGEFQGAFWDQMKLLWIDPTRLDDVLDALEAVAP